eukprot:7979434-Pyramimonas_sp.AAC.1
MKPMGVVILDLRDVIIVIIIPSPGGESKEGGREGGGERREEEQERQRSPGVWVKRQANNTKCGCPRIGSR